LAFEEEEERRRRDWEGGGWRCRKRTKEEEEEEEEGGLRVVGRRETICGRRKEAEGDVEREKKACVHDARRRTRKRDRACIIRGWWCCAGAWPIVVDVPPRGMEEVER